MQILKNNLFFNFLILSVFMLLITDSVFAQQIIKKENNGFVKLWMEAEAGSIESPMKIWDKNDASGGQFIEVISGNNSMQNAPHNGHITYKFAVKNAGIYKVWGRVIASMDDEDAFWVKMDNKEWLKWKDITVGCNWHWDAVHDNDNNNKIVNFKLSKGLHTLVFTYLLDQTRLDKLLITNDLNFVPTEIGPRVKALFDMSSSTPEVSKNVHFNGSESVSSEGTIISYDWDFGDGGKARGKSLDHMYTKKGDYQVKLLLTDEYGLSTRLSKTLTAYTDDPIARFIYFPDRAHKGESIHFDASSSFDPDGTIENYTWDFGDGFTENGIEVKHSFISAGAYSTILTVTDSENKIVKKKRLVTVITGIPKKIIFETDMCLDVDDVGALALLHAMANNDEVELLAVCFNEVHPNGAAAIDAINTWYGRGDIPVGIYKKALSKPDYSPYLESVSKFPHDLDSKSALSTLDVYKKVLSEQPDGSVTIISVGFLNNLDDLLRAEPDLIAKKVKELVQMGGLNNDGFNLSRHNLVSASENIIRNWPTPLVISQPGGNVLTGPVLKETPAENPVREAFYKFFHNNFCERPSWDEMAVLYGVRGLSDYFSRNTTITGSLQNGYKWKMEAGHRSFLRALLPVDSFAKIIQALMLEPPRK